MPRARPRVSEPSAQAIAQLDGPRETALAELFRQWRERSTRPWSPLRWFRLETCLELVLVLGIALIVGARTGYISLVAHIVASVWLVGGGELLPIFGLRPQTRSPGLWLCDSIRNGRPTSTLVEVMLATPLRPGDLGSSIYHELRNEQQRLISVFGLAVFAGFVFDAMARLPNTDGVGLELLLALPMLAIAWGGYYVVAFLAVRSQAVSQFALLVGPPDKPATKLKYWTWYPLNALFRLCILSVVFFAPVLAMGADVLDAAGRGLPAVIDKLLESFGGLSLWTIVCVLIICGVRNTRHARLLRDLIRWSDRLMDEDDDWSRSPGASPGSGREPHA